jgi:hypothetical protein
LFNRINWKIVIAFGVAAIVVSLTLGGINKVRLVILIFRALVSGVFTAGLTVLIQFLIHQFLPELASELPPPESPVADEPSVDITMPRENIKVEFENLDDDEDEDGEPVRDAEELPPEKKDEGPEPEDREPSADPDTPDSFHLGSLDDWNRKDQTIVSKEENPAEDKPVSGGSGHEKKPEGKKPSAKHSSSGKMDSLPDLDDFSTDFSEESGGKADNADPGAEAASSDSPRSRKEWQDQQVQEFLETNNEPETMAKSISTILKKDQTTS